jgi:hypothetical protein
MGNKLKNKRSTARRAASFLAVLGVLVMSSGVALVATAGSANAATKVTFCHSTGSEQNPWVELTTSVNAFYVGHVLKQHTSDIYPAVSFQKGGQTINVPAQGDLSVLENDCGAPAEPGDLEIAVDIEFTDPSCTNNNTASYVVTGDNEDVVVEESAAPAPGASITVTATPKEGFFFDGAENYSEMHTFAAAAVCNTVVSPPENPTTSVSPPKTKKTKSTTAAVTPTVVHAGLTGATVEDMRAEQGLALMVGGMVLLVAAGGLRLRGSRSRI